MLDYWKIILIAFYLQPQTPKADKPNAELEKRLSYSMNTSARPCDEFFSYACGNYRENMSFTGSFWSKGLLDYANQQYNTAITRLLDKYDGQEQQMAVGCRVLTEKVKNYLAACRKVTKRDLSRYLEELQPGRDLNWPVLEKTTRQISKWPHGRDFDVFYLMGKLRSLGIANGFLKVNSTGELGKSTIEIRPHYNSRCLPTARTMQAMLLRIGIGNFSQLVADVLETDKILVKLLENMEETEPSPVKMDFGDLLKRYPNLNFTTYFGQALEKGLPLNASITLYNPPFFEKLNDRMWLIFDKPKLCSYLMINYLKRFFELPVRFAPSHCEEELRQMFNLAINFLYYQQNSDHIEKRVEPEVTGIFQNIVDMLRVQLESHNLQLTVYEIESLRRKLAEIRLNIGNLPDSASCEKIEQLYSSVPPLDENNYYKNHLLMIRFTEPRLCAEHFEASHDFKQNLLAVSYSASQHVITLNYAYLLPPVYDCNYDNLGKYSLLGFILARQLIVANDIHKYLPSASFDCSEQRQEVLDDFYTEKDRVGDTLASELIRKIVTLKFFNFQPINSLAYWKKHFFLYMAQYFCHTDHMFYVVDDLLRFRLNRIVMNIAGFSQAFSCPEGSPMNPAKKCKIS